MLRLALVSILLASGTANAQGHFGHTDGPSPFDLVEPIEGEPTWAALLRLRAAGATFDGDPSWGRVYKQLRAHAEARAGNHDTALALWDACCERTRRPAELPGDVRAAGAVSLIAEAADTAQVVMVNEAHHDAANRLLTLQLLPALYERGYRYFAAEAFSNRDSSLSARPYLVDGSVVSYSAEPVFGEVVREALRLGYTLVPYEATAEQMTETDDGLNNQQRRDRAQAENLYDRVFGADPDARVLVHAGFAHIEEERSARWSPMALYFREVSGIDPLTVDQTELAERSAPGREHPVRQAAVAAGLVGSEPIVLVDSSGVLLRALGRKVDVHVAAPPTTYTDGRPDWMTFGGRRVPVRVPTPECGGRTCFVEARASDEPDAALPIDRVETTGTEAVVFALAEGTTEVQVFDADGAILRTVQIDP